MTGANEVIGVAAHGSGNSFLFSGLYKVFVSPGELFENLKRRPRVLIPYLAIGIMLLVFAFSVSDVMVRMQMEGMQERGGQLPPGFDANSLKTTGIGAMLLVGLLTPLVAAGLAMFFGNFVLGGQSTYKPLLSVMLYGEVVYMIGQLVHLPLILFKETMMVSLSLAALVPNPEPSSPLWAGLSKIGLFNIWELVVIGIGLSVVFEFSRNKGYMLAVLSMGLLSILQVVTTLIGSAFD